MNGSKTILTVLTILVLLAGPFAAPAALAADDDHPIQDTWDDTPLNQFQDCAPVLDNPISMKDTDGLREQFSPDDIDRDGFSNDLELREGSDPTWKKSTPSDRDGDGVARPSDPCDYDHRIPSAKIVLELKGAGGAAVEDAVRGDRVELVARITTGASNVLTDPDGRSVNVTVTMPDPRNPVRLLLETEDGQPLPDLRRVVALSRQATGVYNATLLIGAGDRSSTWTLVAETRVAGALRESLPKSLSVATSTFQFAAGTDRPEYFLNDLVTVVARPTGGQLHSPETANVSFYAVDPVGTPYRDQDPIPMVWNPTRAQWEGVFDLTGLVTPDNQGPWQFFINGHDQALDPNTGSNQTVAAVFAIAARALGIALENPSGFNEVFQPTFARGSTMQFAITALNRSVPVPGLSVAVTISRPEGTTETRMAQDLGGGLYRLLVPTSMGNLTGEYRLEARATIDGQLQIATTVVALVPGQVPIVVYTDRFEYASAGPFPGAPGVPTQPCAPVVDSTTLVVDTAPTERCLSQVSDPVFPGGNTVIVRAYPIGPAGTRFISNLGNGAAPGTASFLISQINAGVSATPYDVQMSWQPSLDPRFPGGYFEGTYKLATLSALFPGGWKATVSYRDEAVGLPNFGLDESVFIVQNATVDPLSPSPPKVQITQAAGAPVPQDRFVTLAGAQLSLSGTFDPPQANAGGVKHVWVRIIGGPWRSASLSASTWSYVFDLNAEGISAAGLYRVEAVAAPDPGCGTTAGCLFKVPEDVLITPIDVLLSPVYGLKISFTGVQLPEVTLHGVLDGASAAAGAVLKGGSAYILKGTVKKNSNQLSAVYVRVQRVVWANCVDPDLTGSISDDREVKDPSVGTVATEKTNFDTYADNDDTPEWCGREVTTDVDILGLYTANPSADRNGNGIIDIVMVDDGRFLNWTFEWDVSVDAYLSLGVPTTLVRRVNTEYETPGVGGLGDTGAILGVTLKRPGIPSGGATWTTIPEALEAEPYLTTWELNHVPNFYKGESRYWVTSRVVTSQGFVGEVRMPETAQTMAAQQLPCPAYVGSTNISGVILTGSLAPLPAYRTITDGRCAETPAPDTGAGRYPGFGGFEMRFPATPPSGSIDAVRIQNQTAPEDAAWNAKGTALFRITHKNADGLHPLKIRGTLRPNGNTISSAALTVYAVSYRDCIGVANAIPQWCIDAHVAEVPIPASAFAGGVLPGPGGPASESFTISWAGPAGGFVQGTTYWVVLSYSTPDGDRYQLAPNLAPLGGTAYVAPPAAPANPRAPDPSLGAASDTLSPRLIAIPEGATAPAPATVLDGNLPGFPGTAALISRSPLLVLTGVGNLTPPRADDRLLPYAANFTWTPAATATFPHGGLPNAIAGNVFEDKLRIRGTVQDAAAFNDVKSVTVTFTLDTYGGGLAGCPSRGGCTARGTVVLPVSTEASSANSDRRFVITRTLSGPFLQQATFDLTVSTAMIAETMGLDPWNARKIFDRDYARLVVGLSLLGESGFTSGAGLALGVDQDSAPSAKVTAIRQTTIDLATFQPVTRFLDVNSPAVKTVLPTGETQFKVSGNFEVFFEVVDPDGVDLAQAPNNYGSGKLAFVEFSTGKQSPPLEWRLFGANDNARLFSQAGLTAFGFQDDGNINGTKVTGPIVVECPPVPGLDCGFDRPAGTNNNPPASGDDDPSLLRVSRVEGFLMPVRVGFNPGFVQVSAEDGNMWDPTKWQVSTTPDPEDGETQLDVTTEGQAGYSTVGCGQFRQSVSTASTSGDVWRCVQNTPPAGGHTNRRGSDSQWGILVDPDGGADQGGAGVGFSGYATQTATSSSQASTFTSSSLVEDRDAGVGMDSGCGPTMGGSLNTAECNPDPYVPFTTDGSSNFIAPSDPNDQWASCMDSVSEYHIQHATTPTTLSGKGSTENTQPNSARRSTTCDNDVYWFDTTSNGVTVKRPGFVGGLANCGPSLVILPAGANNLCYGDETQRYGWYLLNHNLPMYFFGNTFGALAGQGSTSSVNTVSCSREGNTFSGPCYGRDYRTPESPRENGYAGPEDYNIPRGFIWTAAHASPITTPPVADPAGGAATFRFTKFTNSMSLDNGSADFGVPRFGDAVYTLTVHPIDNVATMSDSNPAKDPSISNLDGPTTTFRFDVDNDLDSDGFSDLREKWVQRKLQNGTLRRELGGEGYVDRFFDPTTPFPLTSNAGSTPSDWDGDGVPNAFRVSTPVGVSSPNFDLELLLNLDPLKPDFREALTPSASCVPGVPGARDGLLGDRNGDCIPNTLDGDKRIFRCCDTNGRLGIDDDQDGYPDSQEDTNRNGRFDGCTGPGADAANLSDSRSRPGDCDGDSLPDGPGQLAKDLLNAIIAGRGCSRQVDPTCGYLLRINTPSNSLGITYVFVDATPNGANTRFKVGYHDTKDNVVLDETSAPRAVETARLLALGLACAKATTSSCGHTLQVNITQPNPLGILHVFLDLSGSGATSRAVLGFHDGGGERVVADSNSAGTLVGMLTALLVGAMDTALDPDGDGYNSDLELRNNANPFNRDSSPGRSGQGFPFDWDGDSYGNDYELRNFGDPTKACSTPNTRDGPISNCRQGPF